MSDLDQRPASNRRPLAQPLPRTWFLGTTEYRLYALREASALFLGIFVINVCWAVVALSRGLETWERWLAFQRHPAVVVFTVITLAMVLLQSVTWFQVSPKAIRVRLGERQLRASWIIAAQYAAAFVVLALLIWRARGGRS
ncbi:MAG: hypothetical protein FWD83_05755 [Promicromonosporaceae bacterium]|nr:hypothetical protein [Promicromonosporaceae bacterium]